MDDEKDALFRLERELRSLNDEVHTLKEKIKKQRSKVVKLCETNGHSMEKVNVCGARDNNERYYRCSVCNLEY